MRLRPSILLATGLLASLAVPAPLSADRSTGTLDVYWVDSEGGGSTLLVTPAGEKVGTHFLKAGFDEFAAFEWNVRVLTAPDMKEFAFYFIRACQGIVTLSLAE